VQGRDKSRIAKIVYVVDFKEFYPRYPRHKLEEEGDLDNAFAHYLAIVASNLTRLYTGTEIDVRPCYERTGDKAGLYVFPVQYTDEVAVYIKRLESHALMLVARNDQNTEIVAALR
jgi:hypothetical protein